MAERTVGRWEGGPQVRCSTEYVTVRASAPVRNLPLTNWRH